MASAAHYGASVMKIPAAITSRTARCGVAVVACVLALTASAEASAAPAAGSSGAANKTLAQSLAAATNAGSARITVRFFSGSTTGRVVQDSSKDSGKQTVAIKKALAATLLVGGVAYFSGNAKGMTTYFGLPSALVPTLSDKWVSVPSSDSAFQSVAANLALPSAMANVTPSGALAVGKRIKVHGQWVKSISGAAPGGTGRIALFVAAAGRPLPVEAVESSGTGRSAKGEIVNFSKWGEPVHVATPTGAIPITRLRAASSASG